MTDKFEKWAKEELEEAGLFSKNSAYDGAIGKAVMKLIKVFSKQNHSGCSASAVRQIFNLLADWKTINLITINPNHWMEVGEGTWQSRKQSNLFSKDGGKTYYNIDDKEKIIYHSVEMKKK